MPSGAVHASVETILNEAGDPVTRATLQRFRELHHGNCSFRVFAVTEDPEGDRGEDTVLGFLLADEEKVTGYIFKNQTGAYETHGTTELHGPVVSTEVEHEAGFIVPTPDLDRVEALSNGVIDALTEEYGLPFRDVADHTREQMDTMAENFYDAVGGVADDCTHTNVRTLSITRGSDMPEATVNLCIGCWEPQGATVDGETVDADTLFDPDWMLADPSQMEVIETERVPESSPETDFYLVETAEDVLTRVDVVAAAFALQSIPDRIEDDEVTAFNQFQTTRSSNMVLVADNEPVGYLSWQETPIIEQDPLPRLHQLFTAPQHRGNAYASVLLMSWFNHHGIETYLAEAPTDSVTAFLENIDAQAGVTHHSVSSVENIVFPVQQNG